MKTPSTTPQLLVRLLCVEKCGIALIARLSDNVSASLLTMLSDHGETDSASCGVPFQPQVTGKSREHSHSSLGFELQLWNVSPNSWF